MRTSLTLCVLVPALALIARAQDETAPSAGPALGGEPAMLVPLEVSATGLAPAPLMMPHALPHYYGRGEWPGFGGGHGHDCGGAGCDGAGCGGATWGCCPRPRSSHLHLWDNYCYETTRCPDCGFSLGSMMHSLRCSRGNQCGSSGSSCDHGGCGDHGGVADHPAKASSGSADHSAVPPPPQVKDESAVKKPIAPGAKKEKKDLPKDMGPPTTVDPMPKPPMTKEPMLKDMPEKTDKELKKTRRVVPGPRNASLLDRLFRWPSSGSR